MPLKLVDARALLLPPVLFPGVDPNVSTSLAVSGALTSDGTTPLVVPDMPYAGSLGGKQSYSDNGLAPADEQTNFVYWSVGFEGWIFVVGAFQWTSTSLASSPIGIENWAAQGANTGMPVFTGDALVGEFVGQRCQASSAEWEWDGTMWIPRQTLSGRQITRNDTDDAYFVLGVDDDGAPTTTPFP